MGSPMSIPVWLTFLGDVLVVREILCDAPPTDVVMKDVECGDDVEMADGMDVAGEYDTVHS